MTFIDYLQQTPAAFTSCVAFIGLFIGSFLNVVIYRLPVAMQRDWQRESREFLELPAEEYIDQETFNIAVPASHCPHCKHPIAAWQNIPVISYLLLRGRCAHCKTAIHWRYPVVEITAAVLAGLIALQFGPGLLTLAYIALAWTLLTLTVIDIDHQLLPDSITLPLVWAGLLVNHLIGTVSLVDALWGAVAGYLSLWSVYWVFKILTGKEGMGYGDFKLLAALGAWLGWQALPLIILLSSLVGAILGLIILKAQKQESSTAIPFGPYLAIAGMIALVWGEQIVGTYWRLVTG